MSHLSLLSLGMPEVRHGGQALKFRTRKALALLVYLAVEGGVHSREKLATLFWPNSDEPQGRTILRTTIVYLRNTLGDEKEAAAHLVIERDSLGFNFTSDFDLDLHTLETAFKLARASSTTHVSKDEERRTLLSQLQRAVALYRGSFLEGFSLADVPDFDDWTRQQREVCHRRISAIFDRLSQAQSDGGEFADALETNARWVIHEPLNESAHRRLMQLYFAVGDHNAALQAYEACRATLARELRVRPSPETLALAERIRAVSVLPRTPAMGALKRAQASTVHQSALSEVPLVGRASEYGELIESYLAIVAGETRVVVLEGEAGIGKTRLASAFLGWAAAQGADVLQGRAFEMGGRLPYQPLVAAIGNRLEQENAPDDLLSDTWLTELSRILPELRDRYPDLPPVLGDETTARIRLFEAITRLVQALAERTPVVFFLDDAHWADAASLDVLHYAGQRWAESGPPILILLSLRTEALVRANMLTKWLASLRHDLKVSNLTLGPLTLVDTIQLVATIGAGSGTPAKTSEAGTLEKVGTWLFGQTRGQPFYLVETLKMLFERGLLITRDPSDGGEMVVDASAFNDAHLRGLLPPGIRQIIRTRLDQLSPAGLMLLTAAAVLGQGFTFDLLCQVAKLGESEALPALDEALLHGLLREGVGEEVGVRQSPAGSYFFSHDKIRDVVYTEAGEARRRISHRRALAALEALQRPPAELAQHALAAELPEPAFRWSLVAGDEAMQLFAVRNAIAHYKQAQQVLDDHFKVQQLPASISAALFQHLFTQLGRAYELNSQSEQAQAVYEAMLAAARELSRASMECVALNHLATLAAQNPLELDRAESLLHQALQLAGRIGDPLQLAETEWNLANLSVFRSDPVSLLAHGERALVIARQLDKPDLIARCLNVMTYGEMMSGRWEEAEVRAEEAHFLYAAMGNRAMEADCLCQQAISRINCGRTQAAIDVAQAAHAISLKIENLWGQVNSMVPLVMGLLEQGAYSRAFALAERAKNLAQAHGLFALLMPISAMLGTIQRAMLAPDAARAMHQEVLAMFEAMRSQPLIEVAAGELCADCAVAGAWEEAYTYAVKGLAVRSDIFVMSTKLSFWRETEALVRGGDSERAAGDVQRFGRVVGKNPRYRIPYLRALAVLAQHQGEINAAIGHLGEAAQLAEEIGLPGELWSIAATIGDLSVAQGDQEQARCAFQQAADIIRTLTDNIENDVQRTGFLAATQVHRALEAASSSQAQQ